MCAEITFLRRHYSQYSTFLNNINKYVNKVIYKLLGLPKTNPWRTCRKSQFSKPDQKDCKRKVAIR